VGCIENIVIELEQNSDCGVNELLKSIRGVRAAMNPLRHPGAKQVWIIIFALLPYALVAQVRPTSPVTSLQLEAASVKLAAPQPGEFEAFRRTWEIPRG
jgi:hypothetical protein